jgi:hypothetical protein
MWGYDVRMDLLWAIYALGAVVALWRTDARWPTRIAVAILWPLGPLAFVVTVGILVAASVIAFPRIAGSIAVVGTLAIWWLLQ